MPTLPSGAWDVLSTSITPYLFTIGGFLLAVFALARLLSERRQPSNTLAWLLIIVLLPYVGVPLYLLIGRRKLQRVARRRSHVAASRRVFRETPVLPPPCSTAQTINQTGAGIVTGGNQIEFIADGEQAFHVFLEHIRSARREIHITTFILSRDATGRLLIDALAERARAGVKVRLLLDGVGSLFASFGFCRTLREAGGEVVRFLPVLPLTTRGYANLRNHRKIAVFDRATAIVGGHNLAQLYMGPKPWRKRFADFGAIIRGPAVGELNDVFLADWCFASRQSYTSLQERWSEPLPAGVGDSILQVVPSGPDLDGDPLYDGVLSMIQEAEASIWIITPYFIPDEVLQRSLIVKARAGCDVTLIVPARSNHPITDFARRHYLRELQKAGARVLLFQPGMLHSKGIIIDYRIGLLGSANFDMRSLFLNFEISVLVYSPADVAGMRNWARSLIERCRPAPQDRRRERPFRTMAEDLSRLLAPLL
jgi:cardiolipin synthase